MDSLMFDVVTVPDFSGQNARQFELRTLFFLASWIEYGGKENDLPLHIAAIGEVPRSVQVLADRCGAEITGHRPFHHGGFANKQRGFEVNRRTNHILLVDTDVIVFSDISDILLRLGDNYIAAAVNGNLPVMKRHEFMQIYAGLEIPVPEQSLPPLDAALNTFKSNKRSAEQYFPFFNAGIVFAPWDSGLPEAWRRNMEKIINMRIPFSSPHLNFCDQPSFAATVAQLQKQGAHFKLLPDEYHVRWQHLVTGTLRTKQTRLLHALRFCRQKINPEACSAQDAVKVYGIIMMNLARKQSAHRIAHAKGLFKARCLLQQFLVKKDVRKMQARMNFLCEKYVSKLIQ